MSQPTATPLSQSVELQLANQPDTKNKYGSGHIRPNLVVFYYLTDRTNAHLHGSWVRENGEATDAPLDQLYRHDDDWPDWLTTLARKHAPAAAPPPVSRADVLREAANSLACLGPEDSRVSGPVAWTEAVETLRRLADEAQTGTEAHQPEHTWKIESPRRDQWASWGATYDERDWALERYESALSTAPQRPFRLVRATTTYTVEAEHTPATEARTPCSVPNPCEDGELCATHEKEQAHTEGEHAFCGDECGAPE